MKLSYEIETFDLGDRKENNLKLFRKIQLEILKPLSDDFFQVNNALIGGSLEIGNYRTLGTFFNRLR